MRQMYNSALHHLPSPPITPPSSPTPMYAQVRELIRLVPAEQLGEVVAQLGRDALINLVDRLTPDVLWELIAKLPGERAEV